MSRFAPRTSAGAFAGGCVGVFLTAVATEAFVTLRRWLGQRWPDRRRAAGRYYAHAAVMLTLYGVHVTVGYFIMLVAMAGGALAAAFCVCACGEVEGDFYVFDN